MLEPFADSGRGEALLSAEQLRDLAARSADAGLELAVHAIGDAANRAVLDALEATRDRWAPRRLRPRIEHAQLLHPDDLARFAALGVTASMQPSHAPSDRAVAESAWGARCAGAYALGSLAASGAALCFGTDAPIEPLDPLAGVQAAATRDWPRAEALASSSRSTASGAEQPTHARPSAASDGYCPAMRPTSSCSSATRSPARPERSLRSASSRRWSAGAGCTAARPGDHDVFESVHLVASVDGGAGAPRRDPDRTRRRQRQHHDQAEQPERQARRVVQLGKRRSPFSAALSTACGTVSSSTNPASAAPMPAPS